MSAVHSNCRLVHYLAGKCLAEQQNGPLTVPIGELPWVRARGKFVFRYMTEPAAMTVRDLHRSVEAALSDVELPWEKLLRSLSTMEVGRSAAGDGGIGGPGNKVLYDMRRHRARKVYSVYTLETTPRDAVFGGPTVLDTDAKVRAWASSEKRKVLEAIII